MARKVSIAMDQAINYRSKYVIEVSPTALKTKHKSGYSRVRKIRKSVVNSLMVLTMALMLLLGTPAPSSQAGVLDWFSDPVGSAKDATADALFGGLCWDKYPSAGSAKAKAPGALSFGVDRSRDDGSKKRTGYEQWGPEGPRTYGVSGTQTLASAPQAVKDAGYKEDNASFAQECFPFTEGVSTSIANALFAYSNATVWVTNYFIMMALGDDTLVESVTDVVVVLVETLRDTMYLDLVPVAAMLFALYLGYIGLVKRKAHQVIVQGILMMLFSIMVVCFLTWTGPVIKFSVNLGQTAGATILKSVVPTSTASGSADNMCTVPGNTAWDAARAVTCMNWKTSIFYQYVRSQFGSLENAEANTEDIPAVSLGSEDVADINWAHWLMEQNTLRKDATNETKEAKEEAKVEIGNRFIGNPSDGRGGMVNETFKGTDFSGRVGPALESVLVSSLILITLLPSILTYLVFLVLFVIMFAFIPWIGILAQVYPRIGYKYIEAMGSTMIKALGALVYAGISIAIYSAIMSKSTGDPNTLITLLVFAIALIVGRKHITTAVSGGSAQFGEAIGSSFESAGGKAGGMLTGAAVGAMGAATRRTPNVPFKTNRENPRVKEMEENLNPKASSTKSGNTQGKKAKSGQGTSRTARAEHHFMAEESKATETASTTRSSQTSRAEAGFDTTAGKRTSDVNESVNLGRVSVPQATADDKKPAATAARVQLPVTPDAKVGETKANIVATVTTAEIRSNEGVKRSDTSVASAGKLPSPKGSEPKDSAPSKPGALPKPATPRAVGLPKRKDGGLPGSSKGGSPRPTN